MANEVVDVSQEEQKEYEDRFLEGGERLMVYDLLEMQGRRDQTTDPDVQQYLEAKRLYKQGYEKCFKIPKSLEEDELVPHAEEIKDAAETMVSAWLMDDRGASMSERVLILGQQYEKILLKDIPESEREGFFVRESLLFSAWILYVGKQWQHCSTTMSLAIEKYADTLPARAWYISGICHLNLGEMDDGIKDLQTCLNRDPTLVAAYSVIGSVRFGQGNIPEAITWYEKYINKGHPDSADYALSLYALSTLVIAPKSKNQDPAYLKKRITREATNYYQKAKEADTRFKTLYGHDSALSDLKRRAIHVHETAAAAKRLLPPPTNEQRTEALLRSYLQTMRPMPTVPTPDKCANCGHTSRKDPPPNAAPGLLMCSACKSAWYCGKDCQIAHYKRGHKSVCAQKRIAV